VGRAIGSTLQGHEQTTWAWSDQEMLNKAMEKLYDEALGKYLDPSSLAFNLALKKYLPRLAATLEFAGSAVVSGFFVLLAPSPIANEFTEARPDNKEISALLMSKMPQTTLVTIQQALSRTIQQSLHGDQSQEKDSSALKSCRYIVCTSLTI
jgi:hypothetical protein